MTVASDDTRQLRDELAEREVADARLTAATCSASAQSSHPCADGHTGTSAPISGTAARAMSRATASSITSQPTRAGLGQWRQADHVVKQIQRRLGVEVHRDRNLHRER